MKKVLVSVDTAYYLLTQAEYDTPVTVRREFSYEPISQPLSSPYITVGLGDAVHTINPDALDPVTGATSRITVTVRVYIPQQNGARSAQSLLDQIAEMLLTMVGVVSFSVEAPKHDAAAGAVVHTALLTVEYPGE